MLKIFNQRLLPVYCLLLTVGVLTSCKKDKNSASSDMIELLSFGPTGARHGDTIKFIGHNLDKVTSIEFTGGANAIVNQPDFKVQTSDLIKLLVPQAAEKGYVTLKTPQGDIVSKTQFNLNVLISVSSMTLTARPGENVTINGEYLNWVKRITFAKDKVVESFVNQSINQLVVTVPTDAETGPLILAYGGTDSSEIETADTLKVTLPLVTGLSPNPIKHQTNLTITGTNLDLATKVIFTGVSSPVTSFVSQNATQLVVKIPAATKKGKITLEAASGVQTVSSMDLDVVLPAVTNMTPNPIDPGANLTVTGTNLDIVTSISFENAPAVTSFVSQTATQIVVTVPMGVLRGKLTLGVLNSTLTVLSPDVLEINGAVPPPTVALLFYDDVVTSNWNGWVGGGWGGAVDYNNSSPVRDGSKSVKIDYVGGWGSPLQLGGAGVNTGSYTTFKISIFGAPGSNGKTVNLALNNGAGTASITIVEGAWTDYAIPISSIIGTATLTDIWLQETTGSGGFTIYVDDVGLN